MLVSSELLPSGSTLTTCPIQAVAPWFSPVFNTTGAYLTVQQKAGDLIDWVSLFLSYCSCASTNMFAQYNVQVVSHLIRLS